jgi:Uma2 family endonuclease
MTIAPSPPVAATDVSYTVAEYFDLELPADTRHEYRHGAVIAMTGGTPAHNEIISNLLVLLKLALKKQPYGVFASDQRLWIPERQIYTYPDVMVIARPLELQAGRKDTVTNPVLIAEVLSPSTAAYDRGEKFAAYRTIPTLKEYLLIDQERPHLEQYVKQANHSWLFTEYDDPNAHVPLAAVQGELAFVDLYENLYDGTQQSVD